MKFLMMALPVLAEIVGGIPVTPTDPIAHTTVQLASFGGGDSICTGSIIEDDIIVTAAHCVPDSAGNGPWIIFENPVAAQARVIAPKYDRYHFVNRWDLAVLKFEGGLPSGYAKATLPDASFSLKAGETVTVAGYGISRQDASDAGDLKKSEVTVANLKYSPMEVELRQTQTAGVCSGDSGGPAFALRNGELVLFGVANQVTNLDSKLPCGDTAVFADLSNAKVRVWLNQAVKGLRER